MYQCLWSNGALQPDGTRICRLGLPRVAKEACVHERNIGIIIRRLIQKQSIEIVQKEASELRVARIYRVYSYREILERRKAGGLEWVVRGRGVEFVDPNTSSPLFRDDDLIIGRLKPGDAVTPGVSPGETAGESPGATAPRTPAATAGLSGNKTEISAEESSSTTVLLRALSRFGSADDEIAGKLLRACRTNAPDCEVAEVVHFVEQKGALIVQDRGARITSPMGFLLAAVPRCFVGDAFRLYREECCRVREEVWRREQQRQAELEQWTREQEAVLADPNASEDEKRLAREVLGKDNL